MNPSLAPESRHTIDRSPSGCVAYVGFFFVLGIVVGGLVILVTWHWSPGQWIALLIPLYGILEYFVWGSSFSVHAYFTDRPNHWDE